MSDIEGIGYGHQQWSNTPAPEPPPVQADELAAAELRTALRAMARRCVGIRRDSLSMRRAAEFAASYQAAAIARLRGDRDKLQVDLARARAFLTEATGTLPASGFANDELGDPWVRWLERVAAYLGETHR